MLPAIIVALSRGSVICYKRHIREEYSPSDQTPMLLDSSTQGNLLTNLGTCRACELQLGDISLDTNDLGTSRSRSDVDHENFVLCQFGDLCLLAVCGLDTEQATEEEIVDLDFGVDGWQLALETEYETNETVGTAKSRVDTGTNTCKILVFVSVDDDRSSYQ